MPCAIHALKVAIKLADKALLPCGILEPEQYVVPILFCIELQPLV